ncbi:MAG: hypothetical protein AAF206_02495 [Bacteroidota bacterium]
MQLHFFWRLSLILLLGFFSNQLSGQSLELMLGHERIFADVQWLKFIDQDRHWSIFSRTRATVDYDNQTDLFSGAYLNYTLKNGLGASVIGKIANSGAGADAGVHLFKLKPKWMLFALVSAGLKDELEYSWFSIFRFTPKLNDQWKFYSSLELFSLFRQGNHLVSVQRLRLGLDHRQFQFGVAGNFTEVGADWTGRSNLGLFVRKAF